MTIKLKMKLVINKFQSFIRMILGINNSPKYVFRSDFPDGKLIGTPAQIGFFSLIDYGGNVKIGKNVLIGFGVIIVSVSTIVGTNNVKYIRKPITIGDNVEIGSNAVILPGVNIGSNTTIGAGAVVNKDIPENVIAVGVPARIIKTK